MTLRRCYDSTSAADLPADGDLYLAYLDGRFANADAVRKRFPRKPVATITVTGDTFDADMIDVEPGNVAKTKAQACAKAAAWVKEKLARGEYPTVYFMESWRSAIDGALKASGVDPAKVGHFAADYDGAAQLNRPGDIGKQYRSPDGTGSGRTAGHYDVSVVAAYWPGVDPRPAQRLAVTTRAALRLLTRRMNRRHRPLTSHGRVLLTACRDAINHALNVK